MINKLIDYLKNFLLENPHFYGNIKVNFTDGGVTNIIIEKSVKLK